MTTALKIKLFDIRNATQAEYRAANELQNRIRAERLPDDPPIPVEEMIANFQNIPSFMQVAAWAAWNPDDSAIVADASIAMRLTEDNKHAAEMNIEVLPEFRQHGIARQLLAQIVDVAQREHRTLLIMNTTERIPAGEAFMNRLGAQRGMEGHTNQLKIAELDRDLIRDWQARAQERATGFELGLWKGPYPEADLEGVVTLWNVMNTAPRDNLQIEDFKMTPEHIRQQEQAMIAQGRQRWTMYAREKATGKFAGYTEVFWHPNRPQILQQAATAVFPHYRGNGLGRWLKAAMLAKILRDRPAVKFIRTDNADSNAAMLKINRELGFKPYISQCVWQVETEKVLEYLNKNQMAFA